MKKVLLVTNIPNNYRIPLFNELNDQLHAENIEFKVVFAAQGYSRRKSVVNMEECRFSYHVLHSTAITPGSDEEKTYFTYRGIYKVLQEEKPDYVIVSGFSTAAVNVMLWCRLNSKKYIIWSGSVLKKGRNDSILRTMMRKVIISQSAAFITYGTLAGDYLVRHGASPKQIFTGINTVDTAFFKDETASARKGIVSDGKKHLLYTGYLVPRKEPEYLLDLVKALSKLRSDFILDIAGDGILRETMEKTVSEQNLGSYVKFHGFKQKNELPGIMAQADIFLFQTGFDIWGLTLNEAMAAGITCIASHNAGAVKDLILEGENGFVADYSHTPQLTKLVSELLDNKELRIKTGNKALQYIEDKASLKVSAGGFVKAIQFVSKNS